MNVLQDLEARKLINLPNWLHHTNVQYLTTMGSHAYGVADTAVKDKMPDFDVYGFAIPPKQKIFPPGILGFGKLADPLKVVEKDDPWQQHHVLDETHRKEWDFQIFGIVRYFELLRTCNPNLVDSLFTPENCVLHITEIGRLIRDNRRKFLGKIAWKKFRGYALTQLKKASNKMEQAEMRAILEFEDENGISHQTTMVDIEKELVRRDEGVVTPLADLGEMGLAHYRGLMKDGINKNSRFEDNKKFQMDRKFLYHIIRLFDEGEQILEGNGQVDLDIQRSKDVMKAVRRGEWSLEQVQNFVAEKDIAMEATYARCTLPEYPNTEELQGLLVQCLEMHYQDIGKEYRDPQWAEKALMDIADIISREKQRLINS